MIVACPNCTARFHYDETRFQGVAQKRFKCPKCSAVFDVLNPTLRSESSTAGVAPASNPPQPSPQLQSQSYPQYPSPRVADDINLSSFDSARGTTAHLPNDPVFGNQASSVPQGFHYSLAFLSGPNASTVRPINAVTTVIGREEGDVITGDPECSRRHCELVIHSDATVWLRDLGSTNGTFVDGVQIFGTLQLHDRMEFMCGRSNFMMLIRSQESSMF